MRVRDEDPVDGPASTAASRRRCQTRRRSTGSVTSRVPSRSITTVLCPSQVSPLIRTSSQIEYPGSATFITPFG